VPYFEAAATVRDRSGNSRESVWSRHGEHLGASPVRWTGLALSTRNPEQIHWIVTKPGHQPTPVSSTSTYRTAATAGRKLVCVTSTDTRQQPAER
jgi:hypothetical protein